MDALSSWGILITRHGHGVAKILPVRAPSCVDLIGAVPLLRDNDDDLFSTGGIGMLNLDAHSVRFRATC
jgi:hypothetical protein